MSDDILTMVRNAARAPRTEPACWEWEVTDELRSAAARLGPRDFRDVCGLLDDWQDERCAICGRSTVRRGEVVDHDHVTALVRGLLCRSCNGQEGHSGEALFERYRERPPAVILGFKVTYYTPIHGWARPEPEEDDDLDASPVFHLAKYLAQPD